MLLISITFQWLKGITRERACARAAGRRRRRVRWPARSSRASARPRTTTPAPTRPWALARSWARLTSTGKWAVRRNWVGKEGEVSSERTFYPKGFWFWIWVFCVLGLGLDLDENPKKTNTKPQKTKTKPSPKNPLKPNSNPNTQKKGQTQTQKPNTKHKPKTKP